MEMCYDGALVLPSSYAMMDEEEMTYVEGGRTRKISTLVFSAPIDFLICVNPYVGAAFGSMICLAQLGFKAAAKKATRALLKTCLKLASKLIGHLYSGAAFVLGNVTSGKVNTAVNVFFSCFGGLGSLIGLGIDACDGKVDGYLTLK